MTPGGGTLLTLAAQGLQLHVQALGTAPDQDALLVLTAERVVRGIVLLCAAAWARTWSSSSRSKVAWLGVGGIGALYAAGGIDPSWVFVLCAPALAATSVAAVMAARHLSEWPKRAGAAQLSWGDRSQVTVRRCVVFGSAWLLLTVPSLVPYMLWILRWIAYEPSTPPLSRAAAESVGWVVFEPFAVVVSTVPALVAWTAASLWAVALRRSLQQGAPRFARAPIGSMAAVVLAVSVLGIGVGIPLYLWPQVKSLVIETVTAGHPGI